MIIQVIYYLLNISTIFDSRKHVLAKYLKTSDSRKFILVKYDVFRARKNQSSRKLILIRYSKCVPLKTKLDLKVFHCKSPSSCVIKQNLYKSKSKILNIQVILSQLLNIRKVKKTEMTITELNTMSKLGLRAILTVFLSLCAGGSQYCHCFLLNVCSFLIFSSFSTINIFLFLCRFEFMLFINSVFFVYQEEKKRTNLNKKTSNKNKMTQR